MARSPDRLTPAELRADRRRIRKLIALLRREAPKIQSCLYRDDVKRAAGILALSSDR
jgi:hypothetical protein